MYDDAMRGIHAHLITRTRSNETYTSELIPEHHSNGDVYVPILVSVSFLVNCDLFGDQDLVARTQTRSPRLFLSRAAYARCGDDVSGCGGFYTTEVP